MIFFEKSQFKFTDPENVVFPPSTYLQNTKVSTENPSLDKKHIKVSFMIQLFDPTPQTFKKPSFHP